MMERDTVHSLYNTCDRSDLPSVVLRDTWQAGCFFFVIVLVRSYNEGVVNYMGVLRYANAHDSLHRKKRVNAVRTGGSLC